MKKPAYGLNDAPRRWWNIVDKALLSYGLVPTRADRCTYVLYGKKSATADAELRKSQPKSMESAIDYLLDPIAGNNARGREVHGVVCLHVCWTKACVEGCNSIDTCSYFSQSELSRRSCRGNYS